jgi:prepilin-type processing-associated H-X9-DG protein
MTDPQPDATAWKALEARLAARIYRLERAQKRIRWTHSLLVAGLIGSLVLSGAIIFDPGVLRGLSGVGTEVRAHRFVLEDEDGNLRGLWQLDDDGTVRLSVHDVAGRPRMNLVVRDDGAPGISFVDESDRRRVVLGLLPDQTSTLVFADGSGVPRAVLGTSGKGSANLLFADGRGVSRVSLGLDETGAANLILPDSGGDSYDPAPASDR